MTVLAAEVSDLDGPADQMAANYSWGFTTQRAPTLAVPVLTSPANNSFISHQEKKPTFQGTADPGLTVNVWLVEGVARGDNILLCSAVASATGAWSCQSEVSLASGAHTVVISAADGQGNFSPFSDPVTFTIEFGLYLGVVVK